MAIVSKLAQGYVQTPNCNPRDPQDICRIIIHHFAYVGDAESCARSFLPEERQGSANYCIGVDGDIWCACAEEYRSWASSNREADFTAITIENSNSEVGGDYPISEATWDSLVDLCVDICKRYNFRLNFTGDTDGSLTYHRMYANTQCCGEYLIERMVLLERTVNAILDEKEDEGMTREEKEMMVRMEFNEWLHRDPDEQTLKDLCELIPDDVEYDAFNTSAMDDMLENSAEARQLHRIEAIKAFYRTCLGREASDAEAYGWESGEDASLRKIYKGIYNSEEAENYRKRHFTA